ncbi:MAG: ClpXP protease specificity-enhancing factor [Serpentinimonas sp.]|nr:ClpXP protease specificity-enhancing factor [Serpentinimonas sp.]
MSKDPIPSTRPYLIRALHEWCTDHGFSPYIAVRVDDSVKVPREHVKNHEIVLNVSYDATGQLLLGNEFIEFKARFGGVARELVIPVDHVVAIYARENGQGMAFPAPPVPPTQGATPTEGSSAVLTAVGASPPEPRTESDAAGEASTSIHAGGKGLQLVSSHSDDAGSDGPGDTSAATPPAASDSGLPPEPPSTPPTRPTLTRVK